MSNVYEIEPSTNGKVIIYTTYGPLEVELWGKECPLSTRNFIQLCLEGYYDQTIFHRNVPGFVLQGGDPTGTGAGGEAVNGRLLPEYHTRLKWSRRGLMGIAAMNERGEGGSQFFFTLAETPELYRKSTLLGKMVGHTVFNLVRMSELPMEEGGTERFVNPPKILKTEVLINPFDDIIPRELEEVWLRRKAAGSAVPHEKPKRVLMPTMKNKKVLSFEDEDGEGDVMENKRIKSSHEVLNDPLLSKKSVEIIDPAETKFLPDPQTKEDVDTLGELQSLRESNRQEVRSKIAQVREELKNMSQIEPARAADSSTVTTKIDSLARFLGVGLSAMMKSSSVALPIDKSSAYKERKKVIMGKKSRSAMDEMDTLLALNNFREKLKRSDTSDPIALSKTKIVIEPARKLDICKLHGLVNCESCRDVFGLPEDETTEEGWLMHRLVFDKDAGYRDIRNDLDQLKVIDPRERANQFKK